MSVRCYPICLGVVGVSVLLFLLLLLLLDSRSGGDTPAFIRTQPTLFSPYSLAHNLNATNPPILSHISRVASSSSSFQWISHPTPLWQGIIERKGQTIDIRSVSFIEGRMIFHGLQEEEKDELKKWMEPYMHFSSTGFHYDKIEDVVGFEDNPLDWSTCDALQPNYSFFVTPWQSQLFYHAVCEHLINVYANVRSANALPSKMVANFSSPLLQSSHPRSVFTLPHSSPLLSHSTLYIFDRHTTLLPSTPVDLLSQLFEGDLRSFSELEGKTRTCFRQIRWGRGAPFHYFAKTFPFPLPQSHPLYSEPLSVGEAERGRGSLPAEAAKMAESNLSLYSDIELGRWSGTMIDLHNWMMHSNGLTRRVRPARDSHSHQPILLVDPPPHPRVVLVRRKGANKNRFIANPSCLHTAMSQLDPPVELSECCNSSMSMLDQVSLFQQSDVLLGLHGAALTNLIFMPPGGLVVELSGHHGYEGRFFPTLANHFDHTFVGFDARPFHSSVEGGGHLLNDSFCIDVVVAMMERWRSMHNNYTWRFRNVII